MTEHKHTHDGHSHVHTHSHGEGEHVHVHGEHTHTHSPEHKKAVLNRMSRIIGHMESVKKMVENDRDCTDVLIQLSAVNSALQGVSRAVLKELSTVFVLFPIPSEAAKTQLERIGIVHDSNAEILRAELVRKEFCYCILAMTGTTGNCEDLHNISPPIRLRHRMQ